MLITSKYRVSHMVESLSASIGEAVEIVIGRDVVVDTAELSSYVGGPLAPVLLDLLHVAGVVAFIDRKVKRSRKTFRRSFQVDMCVSDINRWSEPTVRAALESVLGYLSGDEWQFSFRTQGRSSPHHTSLSLLREDSAETVVTYSGGLDSYCGVRDWLRIDKRNVLVAHTATNVARPSGQFSGVRNSRVRVLQITLSLGPAGGKEASYRTRIFTYLCAAAVVARLSGACEVRIYEGGQGAIGPYLVRYGDEHSYVSTSPMFTARLALFLNTLVGSERPLKFVHPAIWLTKSQLIRSLSGDDASYWQQHLSCSIDLRRQGVETGGRQCGLCSNCLLRRMSLHAAGLSEFCGGIESYYWNNLSHESYPIGVDGHLLPLSNSQRHLMVTSIANLTLLGQAHVKPEMRALYESLVFELADALQTSSNEIRLQLSALLSRHKEEWETALDSLPVESFVRQLASEHG